MSSAIDLTIPRHRCTLTTLNFPCASRGIDFAVQEHTDNAMGEIDEDDQFVITIDATIFHSKPAIQRGYTKRIGFRIPSDAPASIYGGSPINAALKAINHRAYFLAPTTEIYTVTSSSPDDAVFVWVGPDAFNARYTTANANIAQVLRQRPVSFGFLAEAGVPLPLRVLYINGPTFVSFGIEIKDPAGNVIFGENAVADTPFFIPYTCDRKSPPFQPWGEEKA